MKKVAFSTIAVATLAGSAFLMTPEPVAEGLRILPTGLFVRHVILRLRQHGAVRRHDFRSRRELRGALTQLGQLDLIACSERVRVRVRERA